MTRFHRGSALLFTLSLALALAGCGARGHSADSAATPDSTGGTPAASTPDAKVASQINEITDLTDQVIIYECQKCGMMFDGPGHCTMDGAELYPTKVTYVCTADNLPVDHAGKCPRCAQNARIMKAKMLPGGIKVEYVK